MNYKELFVNSCALIGTEDIKAVVFNALCKIPDYFYEVPSSSSGKYHSEDELSEGGLVKHVLKTVKVAKELAPIYHLSDYELDLVCAALLLHDCCKSGLLEDCGHTVFAHPILAASLVKQANLYSPCCYKTAKKISKLIASHMGQWNTSKYEPNIKLPLPKTKLQKFVHECDYIASRKDFEVKNAF